MTSKAQLDYLLAVDTHRNFGRAARACHVTQPTLSSGIAKLEEDLGVTLFDRTVQPVMPTAAGVKVIEQARVAVSELERLKVVASGTQKELTGKLSVGVIPTISAYLLPLFLEDMASSYPKLSLEIREMTTGEITDALSREVIDVGILALPIEGHALQSISLFREPFYLFVHRDHHLSKNKLIQADDIDGKELWLLEEGHCFRDQVLKACNLRGRRPALANVKFESGSLETLKRLVAKGLGYTLIPHLAVDTAEAFDDVAKVVKFSKPMPARDVGLLFRRAQLKRPAIDALADSIKKNLPRSLMVAGKDLDMIGVDA